MKEVSKDPLISVIVPVYKVEEYLDRCVESIVNQTYKNLEIILVDDGSPDNCPKMCDKWAKKNKRIKVIHKKNGGVSSARNVGLENSNGKWISFVDSDDWLEPDYYEKMLDTAIKNNVDVVQCSYSRVLKNTKEIIKLKSGIFDNKEYLIMVLNPQTGLGFCHMKLYSKKAIDNIYFDEDLVVGEDALFNERVSEQKMKICVIDSALYNYRVNQESVTKKFSHNYVKKYQYSMEKNKKYIFEKYSDTEIIQSLNNYISFHALLISVNYCCHHLNKNKIKSLKEMCSITVFKEAIKESNYNNLSLTRKITLFTLKHKLYFITKLICDVRQMQNRR